MYPNPFWTLSTLQNHITPVVLAYPTLNVNQKSITLPPSEAYTWADGSVLSLISGMTLECMPHNPYTIPLTFFLC